MMGQKLYSNANDTVDYSTGRYALEIQEMDGNVPLYAFHFSNPAYWYTATKGNVSLVFNPTTAFMYVISVEDNSTAFNMTRTVPTPISDYYHRATINDKGNFQQLAFYKGNGASQWDVVWEAISQPCTVYNICGVFGSQLHMFAWLFTLGSKHSFQRMLPQCSDGFLCTKLFGFRFHY